MDTVDRSADSDSDDSSEEEEEENAGDRAPAGRKNRKKSAALRPTDRAALLGIGEDSDNEPPATGKVLTYSIGGNKGKGGGRTQDLACLSRLNIDAGVGEWGLTV